MSLDPEARAGLLTQIRFAVVELESTAMMLATGVHDEQALNALDTAVEVMVSAHAALARSRLDTGVPPG